MNDAELLRLAKVVNDDFGAPVQPTTEHLYGQDRNPRTLALLAAIADICRSHGVSLAHEDRDGGFLVEGYSKEDEDWLLEAAEICEV